VGLVFGTPGLGASTFAYVGYEGLVPDKLTPQMEIIFPARKPGELPVVGSYSVEDRC
jgi:hypothetical protein